MKTAHSLTRRVCTVLLCMTLLCGAVMGVAGFSVSANNTAVEKFSVDFQELTDLVSASSFTDGVYQSTLNDMAINAWVNERFAMNAWYESNHYVRTYLGEKITAGSHNLSWKITNQGTLRYTGCLSGNYPVMGDTLTLKRNGEYVQLKNFKASVTFNTDSHEAGSVFISFHEKTPGLFGYLAADTAALQNDAVLVAATADVRTGYANYQGMVVRNAGEALTGITFKTEIVSQNRFKLNGADYALGTQKDYKLIVEVVNGAASIKVTSVDETVTYYTGTDTVTNGYGTISIGVSGKPRTLETVEVIELDDEGDAVNLGTLKSKMDSEAKLPDTFSVDFTDLADVAKKAGVDLSTTGYYEAASASDTAINAWVNERFAMNTWYESTHYGREYLGLKRAVGYHNLRWQITDSGLKYTGCTMGAYLVMGDTLTLKQDSEYVELKNFKASLVFNTADYEAGSVFISFHEQTPGLVGNAPAGGTTFGALSDVIIVASTADCRNAGGCEVYQGIEVANQGEILTNSFSSFITETNRFYDADNAAYSLGANKNYKLMVGVVNGTASIKVTSEDETVTYYTGTDTVSNTTGTISVGVTGKSRVLKSLDVQELDENGDPITGGVRVDGNTFEVVAADGYELKAGSLIVTDANGNKYVPQRVGWRNDGNAEKYEIPAAWGATAPFTAEYAFVSPSLDGEQNIGNVGTSINETAGGVRFVSRFTRTKKNDIEYVVLDGKEYVITDYGMLLGLTSRIGDKELDVELAAAHAYIQQLSAKQKGVYYDLCDDHVDMSVCVVNFTTEQLKELDITARAYVQIDVDGVSKTLYSDAFSSSFNEANAPVQEAQTKTMVQLSNDDALLVQGNAFLDTATGSVTSFYSDDAVVISGELSGNLVLGALVENKTGAYINVMVDGDAENVKTFKLAYGYNTLTVCEDLPRGEHTVEISRGTAHNYGYIRLHRLTYTGTLETPVASALQMEFLGDSITCSCGILKNEDSVDNHNSFHGYAAQTARALDADITSVAVSGFTTAKVRAKYNEAWRNNAAKPKDIVVVNLGTNDLIQGVTADTVTAEVNGLLADIRADYGKDTYIIWAYGMMIDSNLSTYKSLVESYASKNSDNRVLFCDLSSAKNTDGWGSHPGQAGHDAAAKALTAFIRENCADTLN